MAVALARRRRARLVARKEPIHTHCVSGLGALPSSATNVPVHEMCLHPADAAHVQMTEKAISRRAPLGLSVQGARALVTCGHRLTKICWQRLAGHCEALSMLRQCRQPNLGAEACQSKSRSDSQVGACVRFRVMNPRSRCRRACLTLLSSFPRTVSGNNCKLWRVCANYC